MKKISSICYVIITTKMCIQIIAFIIIFIDYILVFIGIHYLAFNDLGKLLFFQSNFDLIPLTKLLTTLYLV